MMIRFAIQTALLALVMAGLSRPVLAQRSAPPDSTVMRRTPLELLVEQRAALGLTPEQVERLATVQRRLSARNEPLIARIMVLRAQWHGEQGMASRPLRRDAPHVQRMRQAVQRTHDQIQTNNRAAMQDVSRMLSREQRMLLRELVEANRLRRRAPAGDTMLRTPGWRDGGI